MKNHPVIKLVVAFILGIIIQHFLNFSLNLLLVLSSIAICSLAIVVFTKSNPILRIILTYISIILFAQMYSNLSDQQLPEYPFEKLKLKKSIVYGTISDIELLRDDNITFEVQADSITNQEITKHVTLNLLCRVYEKDSRFLRKKYDELNIGNKIAFYCTVLKARGERNPGEFDYNLYLTRKGICATASAYSLNDLEIDEDDVWLYSNTVLELRKSIDRIIEKYHNNNAASLLRGLLLADRSKIDFDLRVKFVNSGVVHVLAVSGLHVGYIILIFVLLTSRLNLYLRIFLSAAGLIFFLIITGHPPSVFRATIMALVMLLAFVSGRSYNNVNSLSIAAMILLLINPIDLFNPGFQLSFSAVLSIILIHPILKSWIDNFTIQSKLIKNTFYFAAVSIAAQIGTLPFTILYFHKLSILALLANIIVIPVIGVILGVGVFTIVISIVSSYVAEIYAAANNLFSDILFWIIDIGGSQKFSFISIFNFSVYDSVIFYLSIIFFFVYIKRFSTFYSKMLFTGLLIINLFVWFKIDNKQLLPDGKLSILMIDVGQGDGILIKFPDGTIALIDAGDNTEYFDVGERTIIPFLQQLEIDKIDIGFISHMDADHFKGFEALIQNNLVNKIYKTKLDTTLERDVEFESLVRKNNVPISYYSKTFLDFGNSRLYILTDTNDVVYNSFDVNNKSAVFKLVHGENTFLFIGDAEKEAELNLVNRYKSFLKTDVLKAGHHGSKSSSTEKFLHYTNPSTAMISAGIGNKFNHPSASVIERFNSQNVRIYRTDLEGAVLLISNGNNIEFSDWRER